MKFLSQPHLNQGVTAKLITEDLLGKITEMISEGK
jgi:hypothetical protein